MTGRVSSEEEGEKNREERLLSNIFRIGERCPLRTLVHGIVRSFVTREKECYRC